jgi:hypothetical protein
MMVLCITSAPVDQKEIRIDIVGEQGCVETLIVRREAVGFSVYDGEEKALTVVPKDGTENVFICSNDAGQSWTVDLAGGIKDFDVLKLRTEAPLKLKATAGERILVTRSGSVCYFTPDSHEHTYVVH